MYSTNKGSLLYQRGGRPVLSRRPIARLFDGLTDRMENRMENRAVRAHNRMRTIECDFKESDGIGRTLMDRIRLFISSIARIALWDKHNKTRTRSIGQWERIIGLDLSNRLRSSTTMPSNSLKSGNGTPA